MMQSRTVWAVVVAAFVVAAVAGRAAGQGASPAPPVCGVGAELGTMFESLGQGVYQGQGMALVTGGSNVWMFAADGADIVHFLQVGERGTGFPDFTLETTAAVVPSTGLPPAAGADAMACSAGASGNYTTFSSDDTCAWFRIVKEADPCDVRGTTLPLRFNQAPAPPASSGATCSVAVGDTFEGTTSFGSEDVTVVFGPSGAAVLNATTNGVYLFHAAFAADFLTLEVRDVATPTPGSAFTSCNASLVGTYDVEWSNNCGTVTLSDVSADTCTRVFLLDTLSLSRVGEETTTTKRADIDTASFDSTKLIRVLIVFLCVAACMIGFNVCLSSSKKHSSSPSSSTAIAAV